MMHWQWNDDSARRLLSRLVMQLGALLLIVPFSSNVFAVSGNIDIRPQLPNGTPAYSKQSGLQLSVDSTWVGHFGYRPVRLTFSSAKPVLGDVQITVRFSAGFWRNKNRSITVEEDFQIPLGSSTFTTTLIVPQYTNWNSYGCEVWVDGKLDKGLSSSVIGFNWPNQGNTRYHALILPGKKDNLNPEQILRKFSKDQIDALSATDSQLPGSWAGYTNIDFLVAFPADLQRWKETSPNQFAEMLRWVRAGGNLWVFDVGDEYEHLPQVSSSLELPLSKLAKTNAPLDGKHGWRHLPLRGQARQGADALILLEGRVQPELSDPLSANQQESVELASDSRHWFVARDYGMGTLVAFREAYSQPSQEEEEQPAMTAIQSTLLAERLSWGRRHGSMPSQGNYNFNNLLIPDVGAAPVIEFQLLISLFILGIGPLNYWLLKRSNKLPLMLVTVPLAAIAVTVLLFSYGILADGFGIQVRARSFTLLDQTIGESTCWARLSYYAGLAPSKGLKLPKDTVAYPIQPYQSNSYRSQQRHTLQQRELEWGKEQSLTRGWLASRTPTQYQTITARPSAKQLVFGTSGETLKVTNNLGVDIISLAIQDHKGNFFIGEAITAGDSVKTQKSNFITAMSRLRIQITENIPEFPIGFDIRKSGNSWNSQSYRGYEDEYFLSQSLMESQISSVISPLADGWGNGTYIAITKNAPELSLGVDDAVESASFHVVRGIWANE